MSSDVPSEHALFRRVMLPSGRVKYVHVAERFDRDSLELGTWIVEAKPHALSLRRVPEVDADALAALIPLREALLEELSENTKRPISIADMVDGAMARLAQRLAARE